MSPDTHFRVFLLMLFFYAFSTSAQDSNETKELKKIADAEYQKLNKILKIRYEDVDMGQLVYSEDKPAHTSESGIVINLNQIAAFTQNTNDSIKTLFIRFVMAHEAAHLFHSKYYGMPRIKAMNGEGRVYLECHADLMAGYFFSQIVNYIDIPEIRKKKPYYDISDYHLDYRSKIQKVYELIYLMDKDATSFQKTHPYSSDRSIAFGMGKTVGDIDFMYHYVNKSENFRSEERWHQHQQYYGHTAVNATGYDPDSWEPEVNLQRWFYNEARRIINCQNSLAANLTLFGNTLNTYQKGTITDVIFGFKILNNNDIPVIFNTRVSSNAVSKFGNGKLLHGYILECYGIEKVIPAHDTIVISGYLAYRHDDKYTTSIVKPGDEGSLYFVSAIEKTESAIVDTNTPENFEIDLMLWDEKSKADVIDLIYYAFYTRNTFSSHRKGIGVSPAKTFDRIAGENTIFIPNFMANSKNESRVYFSQQMGKIKMIVNAFYSKDESDGMKRFKEMNQLLHNIGHCTQSKIMKYDDSWIVEYALNGATAMKVLLKKPDGKNGYALIIEINGQ